ncbi:MAG: PqqD family protein [Clostridia bacterium]|nr:PqqD family protein [Clostridia bacterium]
MKIAEGFLLRKVANQSVVMPMGKKAFDFNRAITLNETAAFLWSILEKEDATKEQLIEKLRAEYDVDEATAENDIDKFLNKLRENGLLNE